MLSEPAYDEPTIFCCPGCRSYDGFQLVKRSYRDINHKRGYYWSLRCVCCGWNNHASDLPASNPPGELTQ